MSKPASVVLREALALLGSEGSGWGSASAFIRGAHCCATALFEAASDDGSEREPLSAPARRIFEGIIGAERDHIGRWNDDESRSWPEVKAAFERAIAAAEASEVRPAPAAQGAQGEQGE